LWRWAEASETTLPDGRVIGHGVHARHEIWGVIYE